MPARILVRGQRERPTYTNTTYLLTLYCLGERTLPRGGQGRWRDV